MKCTHCGNPLSPAHLNCPRCVTPIAPGQAARGFSGPQRDHGEHRSGEQVWVQQAANGNVSTIQIPMPPVAAWVSVASAPSQPPQQAQQAPMGNWQSTEARPGGPGEARFQISPYRPIGRRPDQQSPNRGFIVAGLCVIVAAVILISVYLTAVDLSSNTPDASMATSSTAIVTSSLSPTPTASAAATSATATSLPGALFIYQAEMASAVDSNSGKAATLATTFSAGQKIYVILQLHPVNQPGAVCLLWYLNGKETTHFEFPVGPTDRIAYSYTIDRQPGAGYVDIFWASTTGCTNALLAQHVLFNVTA